MSRPTVAPRWSRLVLLLAAFLYMGGSVAGPVVHAAALARAAAEQSDGPRKSTPPAHDERDCAVCQAFSAAPLPAEEAVLPFVVSQHSREVLPAPVLHALVVPATARARAPPVLTA
jgi:hypothetical protein